MTAQGIQKALTEKIKIVSTVRMGNTELRFEPEPLDEFHVKKAKEELRESPEVVAKGLQELKKLLRGDPDLVVPMDEEDFLYRFLRPCKWYPQSAFELMKRFYGFRLSHSKFCKDILPSKEKAIFVSGILTPLPKRCRDGSRVLLIEGGRKWKPREVTLEQIFKGVVLAMDAAIAEPNTQVSGVRVIIDTDGLSLIHVTQFTPGFARAIVEWVQRCIPCRLKSVHIVNQPYIFNMVFAIFRPFLQEKLRNRIFFHGRDWQGILPHIDAKALPTRYGGDLDLPLEPVGEALWKYFCTFEEDFEVSNKFGYASKT